MCVIVLCVRVVVCLCVRLYVVYPLMRLEGGHSRTGRFCQHGVLLLSLFLAPLIARLLFQSFQIAVRGSILLL